MGAEPRTDTDIGYVPLYPDVRDQAAFSLQGMTDWINQYTDILSSVEQFTFYGCTIRVSGETDALALANTLRTKTGVYAAWARPTKSGWRVMMNFEEGRPAS